MAFYNNVIAGAAGAGGADAGYKVERSLRLDDGGSPYLSRTPSTAGNQKKFTWSGWIKRTEFGSNKTFFSSANSNTPNPRTDWQFYNDQLYITFNPSGSSWLEVKTHRVFRDPSAWYHIVVAVDTTQGTNTDRVKIYVNGVRETSFDSYSTITQNSNLHINSANQHSIGRYEAGDSNYFPGYLAEINFLDGIAPGTSTDDASGSVTGIANAEYLTDFGEFDATTGVWNPIEYTGSHGPTPVNYHDNGQTDLNDGNVYLNTQPVENIFDGDDTTYSRINRGTNTNPRATFIWQPTGGISGVTKIRIKYDYCSRYQINNGTWANVNNNGGYQEIYNGSAFTLTTLKIQRTDASGSDFGIFVYGVEINDTLISNVGNNGFYLDFSDNSSNAALGDDRSRPDYNKLSGALTTTSGNGSFYSGPASRAFDGSTSSDVKGGWVTTGDTSNLIWAPPTGSYSVSSSLRVYAGYYSTISVNGVSKATGGHNSAAAWITLSHTGAINEIKFENATNDNVVRISAIEIDGTVLVSNAWTVNNLRAESNTRTLPGVAFDGDGDSLSLADSDDWNFGSGDFTVEAWVNQREITNLSAMVICQWGATGTSGTWYIQYDSLTSIKANFRDDSNLNNAGNPVTLAASAIANKWQHIAVTRSGNTWRLFVDGQLAQSATSSITIADAPEPLRIGMQGYTSYRNGQPFDGYISNVRIVKGTAVYTSNFTPSTTLTNVANTELLCCQSSTSATAATVGGTITANGNAYAGNFSDSTPENDSLLDSPTNYNDGTNVGGNYCTFNPVSGDLSGGGVTMSNGNLEITRSGGSNRYYDSTMTFSSGKWYWEMTVGSTISSYPRIGIWNRNGTQNLSGYPGQGANGYVRGWGAIGIAFGAGGDISSGLPTFTVNDTLMFAMDLDNGKIWFGKNGTWYSTGTSTVTAAAIANNTATARFTDLLTESTGTSWTPIVHMNSGDKWIFNPGSRAFIYTPPTGFKTLCTTNLDDPLIANGSTAFDTVLYTGDGQTTQTVALPFAPGLLWQKKRSGVSSHYWYDAIRGFSSSKALGSHTTSAEGVNSSYHSVSVSGSNLTLGDVGAGNEWNVNTASHVIWNWDAGSSNTSISAGGLNSSIYTQGDVYSDDLATSGSASGSVTNAFDGNLTTQYQTATGGAYTNPITFTPSGGLSYTSSVKVYCPSGQMAARINGGSWVSFTTDAVIATGSGSITTLEVTERRSSAGFGLYAIEVDGKILVDSNITPPSVPSIATTTRANQTAGFSISTYQGNGSANQTVAHNLGVAPAFVIIKDLTSAQNWAVMHTGAPVVGTLDGGTEYQMLELSSTNGASNFSYDTIWHPTSTTVKIAEGASSAHWVNKSGDNYVMYAWAPVEGFSAFGSYTGNGSTNGVFVHTGFRVAWYLVKRTDSNGENWRIIDSTRAPHNVAENRLLPNSTVAEGNQPNEVDFLSNGFKFRSVDGAYNGNGATYVYAAFASNPFKYARAR